MSHSIWKDFFFFSKGERSGIVILCCLIGLMFAVNFCLPVQTKEERQIVQKKTEIKKASTTTTIDTFQSVKKDTTTNITNIKRELPIKKERKKSSYVSYNYDTVRVELNSADTTELKRLKGIGSVLSARIVKYRKKLGGFTSVEQIRNVYGLSDETYHEILPHIWIK